jgi:hypothetical protein
MVLAAVDPEEARRNAEEILNDRRFQSDHAPRPFRGALQWIGDRLQPVWDWFADVLGRVPGPVWIMLGVLGLVALATYIALKIQSSARVAGRDESGAFSSEGERPEDPDALEREADDAERNGDLDRAVRLRFRAGLIRLGARGAIEYRPSVTTGEVRRVLGSETFDDLASTFDAVAYGGLEADEPDVVAARADWPRVLDETRRR